MKHVFIINPYAGPENNYNKIKSTLVDLEGKYDIEIHQTAYPKEATEFVKNYALSHPKEEIRFYACGGDGTLNEVVSGAVGFENISVGIHPCGSGNDFVKSIGGQSKYTNIEEIMNLPSKKIDIIKVGDNSYSINVCNYGFEAKVAKHANLVKIKGKNNPYLKGVINALFTGMKNHITVEVDGEIINPTGTMLLGGSANGGYVGGKYFCAPRFVLDDGLLEVSLVKCVSVFTLLKLIKQYELGKHLEDKRFDKLLIYKRAKKVKLYSDKPFDVCVDGEIVTGTQFDIEIINKAINFAISE